MALVVKNLPASAGGIRHTGSSPGGGRGNPSSILAWRIPKDRGAWQATVHTVTQSQTQLKGLSTHARNTLYLLYLFIIFYQYADNTPLVKIE